MVLEFTGEITDPIHKYIRFTEVEKELIDTEVFQRLRKIRQLAGAHLVYPSAQHTRFEHSIGAMHLVGLAAQTLLDKGYILCKEDVESLRIAALLHDIGHGPFSHLFEEVLVQNKSKKKINHEIIGKKIIKETIIIDILGQYGYNPDYICQLSFGESQNMFYNEMIAGSLSADIMDYLPRDSFFTGAEYGKIDYYRLISSLKGNKFASGLALDYKKRKLFKCVYEKFLQNKHNAFDKELASKQIRDFLGEITDYLDIDERFIFIDISRTPSMPLTPSKEELYAVMLVDKDLEFETPTSDIPLIDSITGFLDMIRIYTPEGNREKLEKALSNMDLK